MRESINVQHEPLSNRKVQVSSAFQLTAPAALLCIHPKKTKRKTCKVLATNMTRQLQPSHLLSACFSVTIVSSADFAVLHCCRLVCQGCVLLYSKRRNIWHLRAQWQGPD